MTHTHQLLRGLAERHPGMRLAVTQTGAAEPGAAVSLLTPEGVQADLRYIATRFPQLQGPSGAKDKLLVRRWYEERIDDPGNPVWRSLAEQYAKVIRDAGIADLLLQNINPITGVLKAQEMGLLGDVRLTGVVHDAVDAEHRFRYLARRMSEDTAGLTLIAVSESVRQTLLSAGVPASRVRTVHNGLDLGNFEARLRHAREAEVFGRVRDRNWLYSGSRIVLVSARRVPWKGHEDVIRAAARLKERGVLEDTIVVMNGAGLVDSRCPGYEAELARLITKLGLSGRVVLLDALSPEEVASCYAAAHVAVHPSREPEPFGYANIEAMLAGVPVIAAGHGGPLEYIDDEISGLLVPPGSPVAIAAALERVLNDDALHDRLARAGRASAERFTLDAMVDGYEAVLTAAAASPVAEGAGAR
ncbi:glycosyltransferase family 4 protein [Streptomyces javensis]|uniref:D-inositol 3-phosphate glycosyltransferase n=1 Tax=Streptomyces javensis TaxID=114698 RepID=A0ABS0R2N1_9ACTN|nr:glycosyltransferase family 4 protein [Streptomyces javensis]MBI0311616.1 glycosyltransferase family 4 protein [Streptomyces javensis]